MTYTEFGKLVIVYGGGVALLLVALILVKIIAKAAISKKVRKVVSIGMTLEDLERMRRTGFIYDEEYQRARAKVAERVLESKLPKSTLPAETALQAALSELEQERATAQTAPSAPGPPGAARGAQTPPAAAAAQPAAAPPPAPTPAKPPQAAPAPQPQAAALAPATPAKAPQRAPAAPSAAPTPKRPQAPPPFDLEKLRASGAIDEAEYQRLRAYFARRRGGK